MATASEGFIPERQTYWSLGWVVDGGSRRGGAIRDELSKHIPTVKVFFTGKLWECASSFCYNKQA
ncbi:MAG: hypothetical protein Q8N84_00050 [bacterium]|nr:hypothetical protein [bacterium]